MGLAELLDIGFLGALFHAPDNVITIGAWISVGVGFIVQWLLLSKTRGRNWLILAGILAIGTTVCEIGIQQVFGWSRLIPLGCYGILISMGFGAGVAFVCYLLRQWLKAGK